MTVPSSPTQSMQYSQTTIARAERAIRCSPFRLKLLTDTIDESVKLGAIAGRRGVELGYTRSPLSELGAEDALLWLIRVGVLRREVDGQGITDSFRLTPLGRQVVKELSDRDLDGDSPSWRDRLADTLNRRLRSPL